VIGPLGLGLSFGVPVVLAQCPSNVHNALVKRHLAPPKNYCQPIPINPFLLDSVLPRLSAAYQSSLPAQMGEAWRVGKKTAKLAAIDRDYILGEEAVNKGASFPKFEVCANMPTKARMIQGNRNEFTAYREPEEYAAIADALKSMADSPFHHDGVEFTFVYASGLSHDGLSDLVSQWLSNSSGIYLDERDGSNWDSTMQVNSLWQEYLVYQALNTRSADLFWRRETKATCRVFLKTPVGRVVMKYITSFKRLSGDWNTSVGNTIISMIIIFNTIVRLPPHLRPQRVRALFMGDDYLGFYSHASLPCPLTLTQALDDGESTYGITPKRALFTDPLRVSFISLGLWPRIGGGYQFVPHPGKQLRKLFWTTKRLHPNKYANYCRELCVAFWPVYHGFRLITDFLRYHYTQGPTTGVIDKYNSEQLTTVVRGVNWREGFTYKYGVPHNCLPVLPSLAPNRLFVLNDPVVTWMLALETSDPDVRPGNLSYPHQALKFTLDSLD